MNINDRDRRLLFILIVVILVGVFYFVPYKLINGKESTLKEEVNTIETQIDTLRADLERKRLYTTEIDRFKYMIENSNKRFPGDNSQERIIYTLNDMENRLDVNFSSVSFGEDAVVKVSNEEAYKLEENYVIQEKEAKMLGTEDQLVKPEIPSYDKLLNTRVATSINTNYQGIKDLLDYLYPIMNDYGAILSLNKDPILNRRVVLEDINISLAESEDEEGGEEDKDFEVSFILSFYALENENREKSSIYLGEYNIGKDKGIFEPYSSLAINTDNQALDLDLEQGDQASKVSGKGALIEEKSDFFIMVSPISSDNPTVVMGQGADSARRSYVYADRNGTTNVEMQFYQYSGDYYYRYKAGTDSYPVNYSSGIKFIPGEYIEIKALGRDRNAEDDLANINVTILNGTDIPVNFYFMSEDSLRPRVNIVKTEGNVITP